MNMNGCQRIIWTEGFQNIFGLHPDFLYHKQGVGNSKADQGNCDKGSDMGENNDNALGQG